jgi:hydroxymethylpyrimidine/phosphomethylpyrimidine kinase
MQLPVALTIAGSDSSAGAGIQADLCTFKAMGVWGTTVVTAVTAQNTAEILGIQKVDPDVVADQIKAILTDFDVRAIKIGMLYDSEIIKTVSQQLENYTGPIVLDPIFVSSSGTALLMPKALKELEELLFPKVTLLMPNRYEAESLSGIAISNYNSIKAALSSLIKLGPSSVLLKGGHLQTDWAADYFFDGQFFKVYRSKRMENLELHGAGCVYSSAIAAALAKGYPLDKAIRISKRYISRRIQNAHRLGKGRLLIS